MPDAPLTVGQAAAVLGDASGRDLRWFFEIAFNPELRLDYAVTAFETASAACDTGPCYQTRVTLTRMGDVAFTGSSRQPLGPFDAGTGIVARVDFADGQSLSASWDGRAAARELSFQSAAPARSARLDPDDILLLDPTPLDRSRFVTPQTNVSIVKWLSRWTLWLQDALLTYSMLV